MLCLSSSVKERKCVQCIVERNEGRALRKFTSSLVLCFAFVCASAFLSCLCIQVSVLLCFFSSTGRRRTSLPDLPMKSSFNFQIFLVAIGEKVLVVCGLVLGFVIVLHVVDLVRQWFVYSWCALAIDDPFDDELCKHSVVSSRVSRSDTLRLSDVGTSCPRGCFCLRRFVGTLFSF